MTFEELCQEAASESENDKFAEVLELFISDSNPEEFKLLRHILIRCATE